MLKPDSQAPPCKHCEGKGYVIVQVMGGEEKRQCPVCNGAKTDSLRTK